MYDPEIYIRVVPERDDGVGKSFLRIDGTVCGLGVVDPDAIYISG
jgi:hypothetical protein